MNRQINKNYLKKLLRTQTRCALCGWPVKPEQASLDHIVPKSLGGSDLRSNLQLAHKDCNRWKGNGEFVPKNPVTQKEILSSFPDPETIQIADDWLINGKYSEEDTIEQNMRAKFQ